MCMGNKLSKRSLQRYKKKNTNSKGYIRVWKVVVCALDGYYPQYNSYNIKFQPGINKARYIESSDPSYHIHAFRDRKSAKEWYMSQRDDVIVSCLVRPEWISAIGRTSDGRKKTLTTRKIIIPKYPDKCARR